MLIRGRVGPAAIAPVRISKVAVVVVVSGVFGGGGNNGPPRRRRRRLLLLLLLLLLPLQPSGGFNDAVALRGPLATRSGVAMTTEW